MQYRLEESVSTNNHRSSHVTRQVFRFTFSSGTFTGPGQCRVISGLNSGPHRISGVTKQGCR